MKLLFELPGLINQKIFEKNQRSSDFLITDDSFTFARLADHIAAEAAMQKMLGRTLDDGSPVHRFQTSPCQHF